MGRFLVLVLVAACTVVAQTYVISTIAGGALPPTPIAGVSASIGVPSGVTTDSGGSAYFTSLGCVFKLDPNGVLTAVAGNGRAGYLGGGALAISAMLNEPTGLATDRSGNLYIADTNHDRVRRVSPDGLITTLAGTGTTGYSGDGGPAANAQFMTPQCLALDRSGSVYVTDFQANAVRLLQPAAPVALAIFSTSPLPPGVVGVPYSKKLDATGGTAPYAWSVTAGALPPGLELSAGDIISGTPATAGTYRFSVQVKDAASGVADRDFELIVTTQAVPAPVIAAEGIVNAATNVAGPIVAGSLVSIYGANLADASTQAGSTPLPTQLNNVVVTFNGIPAPLVFAGPGQINAQVPWDVLPGGAQTGNAAVVVTRGGLSSAPVTVAVSPFWPGIFALNYGSGNAIAINPDGSLAAPAGSIPGVAARPARVGDPNGLIILATGLGALDSCPANGQNSADKVRTTQITPEVRVGSTKAVVTFSGASPQFAGVNQINIMIPEGTTTGDKMGLTLLWGATMNNQLVTIAVSKCCDQITMTPAGSFNIAGQAGYLDVSSYTIAYTLQNNQASAIPYTLASSANWVTLSKAAGTLAPNGNDSFTVSVNSNANALAAGSYTATVTFHDELYGTTITRTVNLDLSSGACVNLAGRWMATEKGTLTCTVTVNGDSDTETDPINGSDIITISQQGCNVSYTSSSMMAAFGSGQSVRQGVVEGSNVRFSGIMGELAAGFTYQKNTFDASGTVGGNTINLTGSGALAGSGIWQGMNTTFSCTATTTATMTKW